MIPSAESGFPTGYTHGGKQPGGTTRATVLVAWSRVTVAAVHDTVRVGEEGIHVGELFRLELLPEAAEISEGGDAALRGDSGARQHSHAPCLREATDKGVRESFDRLVHQAGCVGCGTSSVTSS